MANATKSRFLNAILTFTIWDSKRFDEFSAAMWSHSGSIREDDVKCRFTKTNILLKVLVMNLK